MVTRPLTNFEQLGSTLGRLSYYHEFIKCRALRVNLLTNLVPTNHVCIRCARDVGMGGMAETHLTDVEFRDSNRSRHRMGVMH